MAGGEGVARPSPPFSVLFFGKEKNQKKLGWNGGGEGVARPLPSSVFRSFLFRKKRKAKAMGKRRGGGYFLWLSIHSTAKSTSSRCRISRRQASPKGTVATRPNDSNAAPIASKSSPSTYSVR